MKPSTPRRQTWTRVGLRGCAAVLGLGIAIVYATRMPGRSHKGPLEPLTAEETALAVNLRSHCVMLGETIGERNTRRPKRLGQAAEYIEAKAKNAGYTTARQTFTADGTSVWNVEFELTGTDSSAGILVLGAHYDSVAGCPGANDNGSGVAALLELARALRDAKPKATIRFVAFVNEEPPFFQTKAMGSRMYARRCRERAEKIVAMLSLETIGFYSDERKSQRYPPPFSLFYPDTGNFIAFVGNVASRGLVKQTVTHFRRHAHFPSEGAAIPGWIPGAGWSDHWAFWQEGYPGVMVTDTAPFRYKHYHTSEDTPDKIDYERTARVVAGLERVIRDMAGVSLLPATVVSSPVDAPSSQR